MQGNKFNLNHIQNTVKIFIRKIELYKRNLGRRDICQFISLKRNSHSSITENPRAYRLQQQKDDS